MVLVSVWKCSRSGVSVCLSWFMGWSPWFDLWEFGWLVGLCVGVVFSRCGCVFVLVSWLVTYRSRILCMLRRPIVFLCGFGGGYPMCGVRSGGCWFL